MICVIQKNPKLTSTCFLVQGVKKGDRVSIYLPMIPELVYTMLACARIGAVHSVVVSNMTDSFFFDVNDVWPILEKQMSIQDFIS